MRSAVSEGGGNTSPAGREEGMEKPKRARRRKPDTAKVDLMKPRLTTPGGQGVRREAESERHEEKDRAVIKGETSDEPVGQRWEKVESALWGRRQTHSAHRNKVCAGGTIRKN